MFYREAVRIPAKAARNMVSADVRMSGDDVLTIQIVEIVRTWLLDSTNDVTLMVPARR